MDNNDDQGSTPDYAPPPYDFKKGPPASTNTYRAPPVRSEGQQQYPGSSRSSPSLPPRPPQVSQPSQPVSYPRSWSPDPSRPVPSSKGMYPDPRMRDTALPPALQGSTSRSRHDDYSSDDDDYRSDEADYAPAHMYPAYPRNPSPNDPYRDQVAMRTGNPQERRGGLISGLRQEITGALRGPAAPGQERRGGLIRELRQEIRGALSGSAASPGQRGGMIHGLTQDVRGVITGSPAAAAPPEGASRAQWPGTAGGAWNDYGPVGAGGAGGVGLGRREERRMRRAQRRS